jgi:signal transduction histidine kinase
MKDKLLSIIAHDLRGPVGNFSSILEIVIENLDTFDKQTVSETLLDLHCSGSKVFTLLENLLSWARNQNDNIDYSPEAFCLTTLIMQNIELLEHTASKKQITFHTAFDETIEVFADKNMVDTVVRNLFTNAIKFSNLNAKIEVSTQQINHKASVSVCDFGVGMNEESLGKIFNPDVYHSTFGTANEKGTGLGLKLCKDFIAKNGGELFAESKPNQGSVFTFTLPKPN